MQFVQLYQYRALMRSFVGPMPWWIVAICQRDIGFGVGIPWGITPAESLSLEPCQIDGPPSATGATIEHYEVLGSRSVDRVGVGLINCPIFGQRVIATFYGEDHWEVSDVLGGGAHLSSRLSLEFGNQQRIVSHAVFATMPPRATVEVGKHQWDHPENAVFSAVAGVEIVQHFDARAKSKRNNNKIYAW
jgi:hypothetical protein